MNQYRPSLILENQRIKFSLSGFNEKRCRLILFALIILVLVPCSIPVKGQPSGGPYGPIHQSYDLPDIDGTIYYVAPDGDASLPGKSPEKATTIEAAFEKVVTGDAIILRGGTYRTGNLLLNQGITMQPYKDEQPVLKGTLVATNWQNLRNGLWRTSWKQLFPSSPDNWWRKEREGKLTPLHRFNNDMVFVDGRFLQSAGWQGEVDENSFFIDYDDGMVYIGTDPSNRLVEITAFNSCLKRTTQECHGKKSDKKGPVIRGITITQYAFRALEIEGKYPNGLSDESNHGKDVTGTLIEHCTISFSARVAAWLIGDHLEVRHCKISDSSTEGLYINASSDVLLEKNIFTRNNIEQITGYYPAAVKIFNQCYRCTCRDNLVIDLPYSNGIWYDVGNVDGRFLNNWVQNVGLSRGQVSSNYFGPEQNGFFFEISKRAICAGNVFVDCDCGILILNSSGVEIYNNTLVNSYVGIRRDGRSAQGDHFGWHPSTGPDVEERFNHVLVNNLLTATTDYVRYLLMVRQPGFLCERLDESPLKQVDYNMYVRGAGHYEGSQILWSPADNETCQVDLGDIEELHKLYPEFSANSKFFSDYDGPLFRSAALGNYELLKEFPASGTASSLPDKINNLLKLGGEQGPYIGAYPPIEGLEN